MGRPVKVRQEAGGVISLLVGAMTLRLAITGDHRLYVRPSMGPWLIVAGAVLVAIGGLTWWRASRQRPTVEPVDIEDGHDSDGHDHHRLRVGWLLVVPIVTLLLVAPPALGSFGVDRAVQVDVSRGELFEPLPPSDTPRAMTLTEFSERAYDRDGASLAGVTLELTGFVADIDPEGTFRLARFTIACCAADAQAAVIRVAPPAGPTPGRDQWVRVTGSYGSAVPGQLPTLTADSIVEINPPDEPYEI